MVHFVEMCAFNKHTTLRTTCQVNICSAPLATSALTGQHSAEVVIPKVQPGASGRLGNDGSVLPGQSEVASGLADAPAIPAVRGGASLAQVLVQVQETPLVAALRPTRQAIHIYFSPLSELRHPFIAGN